MSSTWEFKHSIKRNSLKRIVEDGNFLQSLITKLDMQLSTEQESSVQETLTFIETTLSQLDSDCAAIQNVLDIEH